MKYIRTFENLNKPQIGDYVICKDFTDARERLIFQKFLNENIGQIINIDKDNFFTVIFDNLPSDEILEYAFYTSDSKHVQNFLQLPNFKTKITPKSNFEYTNLCGFEEKEIMFFSDNKKDLEVKKSASKYNL